MSRERFLLGILVAIVVYLNKIVFATDDTATDIRHVILENIATFCPAGLVCKDDAHTSKSRSCCKACSCTSDCATHGRCCFPSGNKQRPPEYHHCLYTQTFQRSRRHINRASAFYMIDVCPDRNLSTSDGNVECGDITIAPWGSLLPVYSFRSKKIFKNQACAACHGERDGEDWSIILACDKLHLDRTYSVNDHLEKLVQGTLPEHCDVIFLPPEGVGLSDLKPHTCYDVDLINTCTKDFHVDTDALNMTKETIIAACQSGFWSPYFYLNRYQNVFCHLCNGNQYFNLHAVCRETSIGKGPNPALGNGFISLINNKELQRFVNPSKEMHPVACRGSDSEDCRRLHCPLGKILNRDLQCEFLSLEWYGSPFNLMIKLFPLMDLSVDMARALVPLVTTSTIHSNLSEIWEFVNVMLEVDFMDTLDENATVYSILLHLQYRIPVLHIGTFLNNINQVVNDGCVLYTDKTSYTFKATFSDIATYSLDISYKNVYRPLWYKMLHRENHTRLSSIPNFDKITKLVFGKAYVPKNTIINRLYYCNHVSLGSEEYVEIDTVIFHPSSGKFFLDNEYVKSVSSGGHTEVRVCMEELGYKKPNSIISNSSPTTSLEISIMATLLALTTIAKAYEL